jgi:hypothetical protein
VPLARHLLGKQRWSGYLIDREAASGAMCVPDTCPMARLISGHRGQSRTGDQGAGQGICWQFRAGNDPLSSRSGRAACRGSLGVQDVRWRSDGRESLAEEALCVPIPR